MTLTRTEHHGAPTVTDGGPGADAPGPRPAPLRTVVAYALLGSVFAVLVRIASLPLINNDTYFHLRFGHEFLDGWSLRHPGSVSTFATQDWVPTQWLPQIVMAKAEDVFGLAGVAWLAGLLFLSLALALYVACRRHAEPLVSVFLVMLTLVACTPGMSMRPQQISYLMVVVTVSTWLGVRDSGRTPWLLVPLTWVWTMCHGMWPVGIVIGFVAVAGLALDGGRSRSTLAKLLAVPVLSVVASLLTPVGPGLFSAVLQVNSRAEYFYEWSPADFTRFYTVVLLGLLALALVPRVRRGTIPWFDLALIGLACLWALYSLRTVPVAACMAAPLAAAALQPGLGGRPSAPRGERLVVLAAYVAALGTLALVVPHTADRPRETPSWLDARLGDLPAGTKLVERPGVRRLPDVALPAARPAGARVRRHLHRRRARAEPDHRRRRRRVARGPARDRRRLRAARPRLGPRVQPAGARGLDGPGAQRRRSSCSSRRPGFFDEP